MTTKVYGSLVFITGAERWEIDPYPEGGDDLVPLNLTEAQQEEAWSLLNLYGVVELDEEGRPQGSPWFREEVAREQTIPEQVFNLGVFMKIAPDASAETEAAALAKGKQYAITAQAFLDRQLPANWLVDVRAFTVRSTQACGNPYFMRTSITAYIEAHKAEWGGWVPTYHFAWGDDLKNRCGEAMLGGGWGALSTFYSCQLNVISHECGHMLGYHHASTRTEDGNIIEYGDDETSIMGAGGGTHRPGFNAYQRYQLGWLMRILDVTESREFLLAPCTLGPECLRPNEYNAAKVRGGSGKVYYLSTYKTRGIPDYVEDRLKGSVFVHTWETSKKTISHIPWVYKDHPKVIDGIEIELVEFNDEVHRVRVKLNGLPPTEVVRLPTETFPDLQGVPPGPDHAGLWYNPALSGQGYDLQAADDGRAVLTEYTFGLDATPRWYIGTSSTGEFQLESRQGGTFYDPSSSQQLLNCKAQAGFTSPDSGTILYHGEENGRGSVAIQKLTPNNLPLSGVWYEQAKTGCGFTINQLPPCEGETQERLVAFFYTYGHKQAAGYNNRWYQIQGRAVDGQPAWEGDVYQVSVGLFHQPGASQPVPVGSARFTLEDQVIDFVATIEGHPMAQKLTRLL